MRIGDKVLLDGKEFLILDVSDDVKIMQTERIVARRRMDPGRRYEDKELDVFLNDEYLNNLSFKDEVITTEYEQYSISRGKEIFLGDLGSFKIDGPLLGLIERKVCAPSLLDFVEIAKLNNLSELIGKETFSLRDAYSKTRKGSWGVANGKAEYIYCKDNIATKPIMVVSKEFLVKNGTQNSNAEQHC